MAQRPIFIPTSESPQLVESVSVEFTWHPGFALSQAQKSIQSLHRSAAEVVEGRILEISSKSPTELGIQLSAFNLMFQDRDGHTLSVESAFQGSKVFEGNRQYDDIYTIESRDAKTDERLKHSGPIIAFRFQGDEWPLVPQTAFYDWLYLQALAQNSALACQLPEYAAFTDIMFNPKKSINCQAHSAALYVALSRRGRLSDALSNQESYLRLISPPQEPFQVSLFNPLGDSE